MASDLQVETASKMSSDLSICKINDSEEDITTIIDILRDKIQNDLNIIKNENYYNTSTNSTHIKRKISGDYGMITVDLSLKITSKLTPELQEELSSSVTKPFVNDTIASLDYENEKVIVIDKVKNTIWDNIDKYLGKIEHHYKIPGNYYKFTCDYFQEKYRVIQTDLAMDITIE